MNILHHLLLALCLSLLPLTASAQVARNTAPIAFQGEAEEARFHALVAELRCVMCQNQSLADSNAQIARDLRIEVLELMRKGMTDAQIKEHLVARYGEFVLYRPRMAGNTWLVWLGPAVVLLGGAGWLALVVRRRNGQAAALSDPDSQEW